MIKIRPVTNVLGILLMMQGMFILVCCGVSLYHQDPDVQGLGLAAVITIMCGALMYGYRKGTTQVTKREGYLIVALGWIGMVAFGTLPYLFTGSVGNVYDAIFESSSGFTTTGATIFTDIEVLPHGVLFWRSITQWIGGMGIVVLTVAILPLLGIGGVELYVAEFSGQSTDRVHPRIKETARRLWLLYVLLTIVLIVIFRSLGMTTFDAFNHSFTTMATGGFSTKNASLAAFSPQIQWVTIVFMLIAGTNFTVLYFFFTGRLRRVWQSDEFRLYLFIVFCLAIGLTFYLYMKDHFIFLDAFRTALFQIVAILTTTGYVTADYTGWGTGITVLFFVLFFGGACAGSTSGGIKLIRHLVFFKNSILEFKRILHPHAMIRIKINKQVVAPRILTHILVFLLIYLATFIIGTIYVSICGVEFVSATGAVATCLGNVGPGIGCVGPMDNFAHIPSAAKPMLSFLMILGRLELFTVLVLFTPYFWRRI